MPDLQTNFDGKTTLAKPPSPGGFASDRSTALVAGRVTARGLAGLWVFAAGMTGVFLMQMFLAPGIGHMEDTHQGVQRFVVIAWVLALGGVSVLAYTKRSVLRQNHRIWWWINAYAVVFAVMFCRGILNWEIHGGELGLDSVLGLLSYYFHESLIFFTPLVVIPFGGLLLRSKPFQITLALHAACGGLVGCAVILWNGLRQRNEYLNGDLSINFTGGLPFYAVPVSLLLLPYLPKLLRAGVLVGAVGWALFAITYQSRIISVMVVCVLCFMIVGMLREHGRKGRSNVLFVAGLMAVGLSLLFLVSGYALKNYSLSAGLEALETRWQGDVGVTDTVIENERYDEASIVLEQMSHLDWVLGRGIGATWRDSRIYDGEVRIMVHLGYLDYTFVGGLGLCWLCCVFPLVCAVRGWRRAYGIKYVAVAYILIHAIELLAYGIPEFSPGWLVTCVCLGAVFDAAPRPISAAPALGRARQTT